MSENNTEGVNRIWVYSFVLLPIILGIGQLFIGSGRDLPTFVVIDDKDGDVGGPEELVFMLQYLGTDYELAVKDGTVINHFEFNEMIDFSQSIVERYRELNPENSNNILSDLLNLENLVNAKSHKNKVRTQAARLVKILSNEFNVTPFPARPPNSSKGKLLYKTNCASCHGDTGAGDGPSVSEGLMDPMPRSFRDQRLNSIAPYQVYNAVTFGVEGTDMPAHETLDMQERWAVSFFVFSLQEDFSPLEPRREFKLNLRELATQSKQELASVFSDLEKDQLNGYVDYLRFYPPGPSPIELLALSRDTINRSVAAYRTGDNVGARELALDAYLYGIEPVEAELRLLNATIVDRLERELASYRMSLKYEDSLEKHLLVAKQLTGTIQEAERSFSQVWGGSFFTFLQSLTIILREGIEAALLVGLLLAYLFKIRRLALLKLVYFGCALGVVAGLLTWLVGKHLLLAVGHTEALEAITSLLAASVLFWLSLWIFHNYDVKKWTGYMQKQTSQAVKTGSGWMVALSAFLAVYREAVETLLFYQVLWLRSRGSGLIILVGFLAGTLLLCVFVILWLKLGIRLDLKPFFLVSGCILGVLSVIFSGYGVRELQSIGYLNETPLRWMISVPFLEIWPVRESLGLQLGIVFSCLLGWQVAKRYRVKDF